MDIHDLPKPSLRSQKRKQVLDFKCAIITQLGIIGTITTKKSSSKVV